MTKLDHPYISFDVWLEVTVLLEHLSPEEKQQLCDALDLTARELRQASEAHMEAILSNSDVARTDAYLSACVAAHAAGADAAPARFRRLLDRLATPPDVAFPATAAEETRTPMPGPRPPTLPFHGAPSPEFLASLRTPAAPKVPSSEQTSLLPTSNSRDAEVTLPFARPGAAPTGAKRQGK